MTTEATSHPYLAGLIGEVFGPQPWPKSGPDLAWLAAYQVLDHLGLPHDGPSLDAFADKRDPARAHRTEQLADALSKLDRESSREDT